MYVVNDALVHLWNDTFIYCTYIYTYTVHTYMFTLCYVCTSVDLPLCHVALALCVCDAGNAVAVSVNDIIIKLVATTLKVSTVHTVGLDLSYSM